MEVGTLKEIGAKEGDKVVCISNTIDHEDGERYNIFTSGNIYTFASLDMIGDNGEEWPGVHPYCGVWRIISRATPPVDLTAITAPFGLLDQATQDALRAHGGPYEYYYGGKWYQTDTVEQEDYHWAHRVNPTPKRETVTVQKFVDEYGNLTQAAPSGGRPLVNVTFERVDGKIDLSTYRVEPRA